MTETKYFSSSLQFYKYYVVKNTKCSSPNFDKQQVWLNLHQIFMVGCVEKLQINYVTLSQCVWRATKPYWFLHNLLLAVDHIWTTVKQFIISWSLEKQSKVSRHKIDWLLGVLQLQILKQYIKGERFQIVPGQKRRFFQKCSTLSQHFYHASVRSKFTTIEKDFRLKMVLFNFFTECCQQISSVCWL